MAATRAVSTIIPLGTVNAAGGTTTGAVVSVATAYGGDVSYKLTNGTTGPTVAPVVNFYGSSDNFVTAGKKFYSIAGDTVASSVNENLIPIPWGVQQVRVDVTGNTIQAVTCEAFAHVVTGQ